MSIPEWNDPDHSALKHNNIVRAKVREEFAAMETAMDALDGMNQSQLDAADEHVDRIQLANRRIEILVSGRSIFTMPGTATPLP